MAERQIKANGINNMSCPFCQTAPDYSIEYTVFRDVEAIKIYEITRCIGSIDNSIMTMRIVPYLIFIGAWSVW